MIESDSETTVRMIPQGADDCLPFFCIIETIRELLNRDGSWRLKYAPRGEIFVADWLGKESLSLDRGLIVYNEPPPGVVNLLIADTAGVACCLSYICSLMFCFGYVPLVYHQKSCIIYKILYMKHKIIYY
ncbi:hypothetical protein ES319_D07G041700v1, partial [Gossypium barbadense]